MPWSRLPRGGDAQCRCLPACLLQDGYNDFVEFVRYTVEQFKCSPAEEMDQGGLVHFVNHICEIIDEATHEAKSS